MDITKKAAEILVEAGRYVYKEYEGGVWLLSVVDPDWPSQSGYRNCILDPFKHDLDGIDQIRIIEDWLCNNRRGLWNESAIDIGGTYKVPRHEVRKLKVKYCLERLAIKDAEGE